MSGWGGGESLPPVFCIGLFLLSEDGWESEKAFNLFGRGGFPPLEEKSSEDENSSSNALALANSVLGLPQPKLHQSPRR